MRREHGHRSLHVTGKHGVTKRPVLLPGVAETSRSSARDLVALRVIVQLCAEAEQLAVRAARQQREVEAAVRVEPSRRAGSRSKCPVGSPNLVGYGIISY
mgnify:CR=1 FL=1